MSTMREFWQSVLEDLVFQHCDGEGLKPLLSEWLNAEDFDLETVPGGFELVPWDYDINPNRLEFAIEPMIGLTAYNEIGEYSLIRKEMGEPRWHAIEAILKEIWRCGTSK